MVKEDAFKIVSEYIVQQLIWNKKKSERRVVASTHKIATVIDDDVDNDISDDECTSMFCSWFHVASSQQACYL